MDIAELSTDELLKDLSESWKDVGLCLDALRIGITSYSGGSVQSRLDANKAIIEKINAEILKRHDGHRAR